MEEQNPWWIGEEDYKYEIWKNSEIKWVPEEIDRISLKPFSLNFLYGPRQVGKTTALKILIHKLLKKEEPYSIFYYSCDELSDYSELGEIIDNYISARNSLGIKSSFIFLDEITFVEEWWRAVKSRIDKGMFKKDVLVITGSASIELIQGKELFPGRRGGGRDVALLPLTFSQYVKKVGNIKILTGDIKSIDSNISGNKIYERTLKKLFENFLKSGGFPLAIIDVHKYGKVTPETKKAYLDGFRSDILRIGKSEKYTKEILSYIIRAVGNPISWNGIASETSINSPNTVRAYVEILEKLFALKVLHFISPDGKVLYRKNKKVHFIDPLIYHAFSSYTGERIEESWILEGTVASQLAHHCPVYYWRNSSEVDIICKYENALIGFEVKKGVKKWKKPRFLEKAYLLDKSNMHLYLASL